MCNFNEESRMRKKILFGAVIASMFLFSACQKIDSNSITKSTEEATKRTDSSSSMRISQTSTTSIASDNKNGTADQTNDEQNSLTNEELAIALFLSSNLQDR